MIAVRPFVDSDYSALAAFMHRVKHDARDAAAWRLADETDPPPDRTRFVAEAGGAFVGWGQVWRKRRARPGTFKLSIADDPAAHPGAIRDALFPHLQQAAEAHTPTALQIELSEADSGDLAFFSAGGFREVDREWESRLDVASFDFTSYAGVDERVAAQGIAITTFATEDARSTDPDALRRAVHSMEAICARDDPSNDPDDEGMPFPVYVNVILTQLRHDGYFLAKDTRNGDRFVGVSNLFQNRAEPDVLKQGLTGVLPEYRRRGIATALKLHTIRYARERGLRQISTRNNTRNLPMLRINESMGFMKRPAWITLERTFPTNTA